MATADENYKVGFGRFAQGDLDGALAAFEDALAADPRHVETLRTAAMVHLRKGEAARAVELGERLVEADPDDVMAYSSLSLFLMRAGRPKDAEDVAAKARVLTWKKQLKEKPAPTTASPLNVLETQNTSAATSAPQMPQMPQAPNAPNAPDAPNSPNAPHVKGNPQRPGAEPGTPPPAPEGPRAS